MNLSETKEQIAHYGEQMVRAGIEASKEGRKADAQRCLERAEAAKNGRLLWGNEETRNPAWCIDHQKLVGGALEHGLVHSDLKEMEPE